MKRRFKTEDLNQAPQKKQRIALYLADYTPIRTIEITNIDDNVCSGYLRGYFEHAVGPVSNVTILEKLQDSQEIRTAYLTFLFAEDAAKLICDVNSEFAIKFTIKEADSAHQPKIDPNVMSFEDINNDCLLHITSYLDLIDIVNLGKTSTGLQSFVQQIYEKKKHFSFGTNTVDSSINELNLPIILQEMGGYIQSIEWQRLNQSQLDVLSEYCPKVTSLKLTHPLYNVNSISIKRNTKLFKNVKTLDIQGAKFFDATMNTIISSSPKLTSLRIIDCNNLCGNFFSKWKSSKMRCLRVTGSRSVDCEKVYHFLKKQKLTTFSFDEVDSFGKCLRSPSLCLMKFKELELDVSSFTDDNLKIIKFQFLKKLTDLTVTSKYGESKNYDNLLDAMSRVNTLKSLKIQFIRIDGDTVEQLGLFNNLQKIHFEYCHNTIGKEFYSSIPDHLPDLTSLSIDVNAAFNESIDNEWICDMISSLNNLKYFSHSSMNWVLLDMIVKESGSRNQSTIEIGVLRHLWYSSQKTEFMAANKGVVKLSLRE